MDKYQSKSYDKEKKRGDGVIHLTPATLDKPRQTEEALPRVIRNQKKKKSVRDIQADISIHGAFGQTLIDLHKQGR